MKSGIRQAHTLARELCLGEQWRGSDSESFVQYTKNKISKSPVWMCTRREDTVSTNSGTNWAPENYFLLAWLKSI